MAKRSREDFEPASADETFGSDTSQPSIVYLASEESTNTDSMAFKIPYLELSSCESSSPAKMLCSLPPHRDTLYFTCFEDYEIHYKKNHTNRCLECRKNFPTGHFLNLHIEENHDALVTVKKERGERTYACFLEDCERKCSTSQKRRMHMIAKHGFPKEYDFQIVDHGLDSRSSMLRSGMHRWRSSGAQQRGEWEDKGRRKSPLMQDQIYSEKKKESVRDEKLHSDSRSPEAKVVLNTNLIPDGPTTKPKLNVTEAMEGLTGTMSSLKFVPPSVRFGRGSRKERCGFSKV